MNTRFDPRQAETRKPNPVGSPSPSISTPPVVESATEARQGNRGMPVLTVLVCGLVLAMLAWGGAEWWGETTAPAAEQTAKPPAGSITPGNSGAAPSTNPVEQQAPAPNNRPNANQ